MYQMTFGMGVSVAQAEQKARKAAEDLAAQRRIYEAEQAQKEAAASTAELQSTVLRWLPRVGVGLALLVGGYLVVRRLRKK